MAAGGNISCECESTERPVDYLGDSVCKVSVSSVREIIKMYEPDREIASNVSHTPSMSSTASQPHPPTKPVQSHVLLEDQCRNTIQAPIQDFFPKQTVVRSYEKTLERKRSYTHIRNNDQEHRRSLTDIKAISSNHQIQNHGEVTYQSKTTVSKTANGVRIITDIQFDKQFHPDNWQGNRVETDIPPSKILSEFQQKNRAR